MSKRRFVKKIIPTFIKQYIKNNISLEDKPKQVEYVVDIKNIKRMFDKRIIVTGATGAIGTAVCYRLLSEGAIVGVCGRNMDKVNDLVKRFEEDNMLEGTAIPLYLDVLDDMSINEAVDTFVNKVGGLDAYINNAGGGARDDCKLIHEQDIDIIDKVINTNLRGTIIGARKAAQIMIKQKSGKIINMSSVVGIQGKARMSDYAAAKSGVIGFTKSLAIELGSYNITVNCISPGMVNQIPFDAGIPIKKTNTNCLMRFGYTDEVANLVSFILSAEADYITGHNFVIDGGRSLGLMGD